MPRTLGERITHVQEKLLPTCLNSLKLWPLAHAINFAIIPPSQRILYVNVIAVSTALCFLQKANMARDRWKPREHRTHAWWACDPL